MLPHSAEEHLRARWQSDCFEPMPAHCQPKFLMFKNFVVPTKVIIDFMRGIVGICFLFSLAVEAAPTAARQSLVVTAQVLEVGCATRPMKKKACAPVVTTTETPQTESVKTVVTTVLYY